MTIAYKEDSTYVKVSRRIGKVKCSDISMFLRKTSEESKWRLFFNLHPAISFPDSGYGSDQRCP